MRETPIEWCDSAANPVPGCDGCELWIPEKGIKHCYAGQLHQIRAGLPGYADKFEEPKMYPGRMAKAARWSNLTGTVRPEKPWLDGYPRLIFVSDMGDALSKSIPFEYLRDEIIEAARSQYGKKHIWLWLTKQPQRMAAFSEWLDEQGILWPRALWVGTSVTSSAQIARVRQLLKVRRAPMRFVSYEPALEWVDFSPWLREAWTCRRCGYEADNRDNLATRRGILECPRCLPQGYVDGLQQKPGINWVIVGGESGKDARPFDVRWARRLVLQGKETGTPVFVKQLGARPFDPEWTGGEIVQTPVRLKDRKGGDMEEWPEDLRVRQLPEVPA